MNVQKYRANPGRVALAGFGVKLNLENINMFAGVLIKERDELRAFRSYYLGKDGENGWRTCNCVKCYNAFRGKRY